MKGATETSMLRSPHMAALYRGDALFIALRYGIPTLAGYSAWAPAGWGWPTRRSRPILDACAPGSIGTV